MSLKICPGAREHKRSVRLHREIVTPLRIVPVLNWTLSLFADRKRADLAHEDERIFGT
jgi:hypothetical protein